MTADTVSNARVQFHALCAETTQNYDKFISWCYCEEPKYEIPGPALLRQVPRGIHSLHVGGALQTLQLS
jgi:hypothetical protein